MKRLAELFILILIGVFLSSCSPSKTTKDNKDKDETTEEQAGALLIKTAEEEQQNQMYSKTQDSTYLYWLDNKLILLNNQTKCNIFAMNVLYKSGFHTPDVNVLTRDLMDTSKFTEILPVVGISEPESARAGDLIVWNGHVIIFEKLTSVKDDYYAIGWWAGTRQPDNGENIMNNVCHGKYKLNGYYIIRRPQRKE